MIKAVCRGTSGELYQGPFFRQGSVNIAIISALANNKTIARFVADNRCNLKTINKFKVKKALDNYFRKIYKKRITGQWTFNSNIKIAAGMSSSTADIVSALRCISQVTGQYLTLKDITDSMIGVERSDSVFIDYPCLYLSKLQSIVEIFKPQKTIYCIYGLENDTLDTSRTEDRLICYYNEEKKNYLPLDKDVYRTLPVIKNLFLWTRWRRKSSIMPVNWLCHGPVSNGGAGIKALLINS